MTEQPQPPRRRGQRFFFAKPLSCGPVRLINIGPRGMQVEHADPMRPRSTSRISIPLPDAETAQLQGVVVWSRLSQTPNSEGKYLYQSGLKLDETPENLAIVQRIVAAYEPHYDPGEPSRKGQAPPPKLNPNVRALKLPQKQVDSDRVLLIRQVRERLRQNPEDRKALAARARSALSIRIASIVNTDEELAIWEYLQRIITLDEIRDALS